VEVFLSASTRGNLLNRERERKKFGVVGSEDLLNSEREKKKVGGGVVRDTTVLGEGVTET
jgi:hypothetical protein